MIHLDMICFVFLAAAARVLTNPIARSDSLPAAVLPQPGSYVLLLANPQNLSPDQQYAVFTKLSAIDSPTVSLGTLQSAINPAPAIQVPGSESQAAAKVLPSPQNTIRQAQTPALPIKSPTQTSSANANEYTYSYNIDAGNDSKGAFEKRVGDKVIGQYTVTEADGTVRVVKYTVDGNSGFVANVSTVPGSSAGSNPPSAIIPAPLKAQDEIRPSTSTAQPQYSTPPPTPAAPTLQKQIAPTSTPSAALGQYSYSYNVDAGSDSKGAFEKRDGDKVVGQYTLTDADGTVRVVKYKVDGNSGFVADVSQVTAPSGAGSNLPAVLITTQPPLNQGQVYQQPQAPNLPNQQVKPPQAQSTQASNSPAKYSYSYNVDAGTDTKGVFEKREGNKVVGQYSVADPDGKTRIVKYTVDGDSGFQAEVLNQ